jgi:hypothetical protein
MDMIRKIKPNEFIFGLKKGLENISKAGLIPKISPR